MGAGASTAGFDSVEAALAAGKTQEDVDAFLANAAGTGSADPNSSDGKVYDTIVVGLGGHGSAIAAHLAKSGQKVLGLEKFGPAHACGSSHGRSRIFRTAYFEDPRYVPLLQRALALWLALRDGERASAAAAVPGSPEDVLSEVAAAEAEELIKMTGALMIGPRASLEDTSGRSVVGGTMASIKAHGLAHEVSGCALRRLLVLLLLLLLLLMLMLPSGWWSSRAKGVVVLRWARGILMLPPIHPLPDLIATFHFARFRFSPRPRSKRGTRPSSSPSTRLRCSSRTRPCSCPSSASPRTSRPQTQQVRQWLV